MSTARGGVLLDGAALVPRTFEVTPIRGRRLVPIDTAELLPDRAHVFEEVEVRDLLATLDLPPSATLRELARSPRVYAMVVDRATPAQLRSLLDNPAVRAVNLADIAFDPAAPVAQ